MATLIQFLAAGVNGAESGTAEIFLRGTFGTSAVGFLFQDFEEQIPWGTNVITLDSHGAAHVYASVYVDVELRTSGGLFLHTVTVGNSAPLVEVRSPSFTGTDYDGVPANTAGEPVTLADVLDRWVASAGTTNWQVMIGGVPTDLDAALASVTPVFVNVKDPLYGAIGDGVTDDTTAIVAAIAAANADGGGIVFFPPGTYPVTALNSISNANITLMGCGSGASIIRGRTAGTSIIRFTDNTSTATKRITGLGFVATAAYQTLMDIEETQQVVIDHCQFSAANISSAVLRRIAAAGESTIRVEGCTFINIASVCAALMNIAAEEDTTFTVIGCKFVTTASYTGAIIAGQNFKVSQCIFDASLITAGAYYHVDAESVATVGAFLGSFTDNTFMDGGSSGYAFDLRGITSTSRFLEDGNTFTGFTPPAAQNDAGHIYDTTTVGTFGTDTIVELGSRRGKTIYVDYVGSNLSPLLCQLMAENVFINYNRATAGPMAVSASCTKVPPGCDFCVFIANADVTTIDHDANLTGNATNHTVASVAFQLTAQYGCKVVRRPGLTDINFIVAWSNKDPN